MRGRDEIECELKAQRGNYYRLNGRHDMSDFDIYKREMVEELFEDDELSAEEEGFMAGYLEA